MEIGYNCNFIHIFQENMPKLHCFCLVFLNNVLCFSTKENSFKDNF